MNYAFLKHQNEEQVFKFLSYIESSLNDALNKGWCKKMIPVWKLGRRRAIERFNELKKQQA